MRAAPHSTGSPSSVRGIGPAAIVHLSSRLMRHATLPLTGVSDHCQRLSTCLKEGRSITRCRPSNLHPPGARIKLPPHSRSRRTPSLAPRTRPRGQTSSALPRTSRCGTRRRGGWATAGQGVGQSQSHKGGRGQEALLSGHRRPRAAPITGS